MLILFVYGIGNLLETQDNIHQIDNVQNIYCIIPVQICTGVRAVT